MNMITFQALAMRTSPRDGHDKLDNAVLGLIGETGEIVDEYKKFIYQSSPHAPLPAQRFAEELGDVLWYLAEMADGLDAELIHISGLDFKALEKKAGRQGGRTTSLRRAVIALHVRADRLRRAVDAHAQKDIPIQMRLMLLKAARLAFLIGVPLEKVAEMNIEKLKKRYPDGFDAAISEGRYAK